MIFIIILLLVITIIFCWKWYKWKFTALTITLIMTEKYREPTDEEIKYYGEFVTKKMLGIN